MIVKALVQFAGAFGVYQADEEFELPEGADWLTAGLVAPVETKTENDTSNDPKTDTSNDNDAPRDKPKNRKRS